MNTQRKNSLLLLLCAFIWGTAFVAQSAGASAQHRHHWGTENAGGAPLPAQGEPCVRHAAVCGVGCPAVRPDIEPLHSQSRLPHGDVCGAGAHLRAGTGPPRQPPAVAQRGHCGVRAVSAVHAERLWRRGTQRHGAAAVRRAVQFPDHGGEPLWSAGGWRAPEPAAVLCGGGGKLGGSAAAGAPGPGGICRERGASAVLRRDVQRRGLHAADLGPAGYEPCRGQPDHVPGKRVQRTGRCCIRAFPRAKVWAVC